MRNDSQQQEHSATKRCAVCNRQFGLIRYYSWRTALCSKKCVDHFNARRDGDRRWLWRFRVAYRREEARAEFPWEALHEVRAGE